MNFYIHQFTITVLQSNLFIDYEMDGYQSKQNKYGIKNGYK